MRNADCETVVSPRGEDLLASLPYIPDDPEPSKPVCKTCGNTGRVPVIGSFTNPCTAEGCPALSWYTTVYVGPPVSRVALGNASPGVEPLVSDRYVRTFALPQSDIKQLVHRVREIGQHRQDLDVPLWYTSGLPSADHEVEVVVKSGDTLRGRVTSRAIVDAFRLSGEESAPPCYRNIVHWWVYTNAADYRDDEVMLRWRYLDDHSVGSSECVPVCDEWHTEGWPEIGRHAEFVCADGSSKHGSLTGFVAHSTLAHFMPTGRGYEVIMGRVDTGEESPEWLCVKWRYLDDRSATH